MVHVLVTGGSGFLGQHLIPNLAQAGYDISVIDIKPSPYVTNDVARFCSSVRYGVDITKPESLRGHFDRIDVVYHLAGAVSFWRRHENLLMRVNVEGTRNVLSEALEAGVSRFVHVSSVAAVGCERKTNPKNLLDETFNMDFTQATHKHYMLSKHLAEKEVHKAHTKGLNTIIVNPGLMWGPGDIVNSYKLIRGLNTRKILSCVPGGTNIVDVRDVASGLVKFASQGKSGSRYIMGGHNLSFREVYNVIASVLGVRSPSFMAPRFIRPILYAGAVLYEAFCTEPPPVTSDNIDSAFLFRYFSSQKVAQEIGWKPRTAFKKTISDAITWLHSQGMIQLAPLSRIH